MKKTIINLTVFIFFMHAAKSQKARIGFTAGSTIANYKAKDSGFYRINELNVGFTAGLIINIAAGKNSVIQTGSNWVQKGTRNNAVAGSDKVSLTINSIEIPVNFLYTGHSGLFVGAGLSASGAFSGKLKINDRSESARIGNSNDDDLKRFDFGANVVAGYQSTRGFLVSTNFNQGLNNLTTRDPENSSIKSHYFGIRIGYVLKSRKS